jgi:precorrin-3B synthase
MHRAADGALARVRLPGGMIEPRQLEALADAANRFGSSSMELTSRGNIQVRGIRDDKAAAALAEAVAAAGLLPSPTHERVRNIVASPLSGRVGGTADVREWVRVLDAAICAEPDLAALPGRFWFSVDDGRGDVSGLAADVGAHVGVDSVALLLAGHDTGVRIAPSGVVPALISIAQRFVEIRGGAWRIAELADTSALIDGLPRADEPGATWSPASRPPVGWISQDDGHVALGAAAPLGVLQARVAEYLAAIDAPLIITPWRSVLVCDLDDGVADAALRVLAPTGLVFDENSPWLDVSACTGSPGCGHSAADVRAEAARAVGAASTVHRHFVGCERACGSPPAGEVLIATGDGYVLRTAPP